MACNIFTLLIVVALSLFVNFKGVVISTKLKENKGEILEFWEPDPQFDTRKRLHYKKNPFETILDDILSETIQRGRGPLTALNKTQYKNRQNHAQINQSSEKKQNNQYHRDEPIKSLNTFEKDRYYGRTSLVTLKYNINKYFYNRQQPTPIKNKNEKDFVHIQPIKPIKNENYKGRQPIEPIYYDDYRSQQVQPMNVYRKDKTQVKTSKEQSSVHYRAHRTTQPASTRSLHTSPRHSIPSKNNIQKHKYRTFKSHKTITDKSLGFRSKRNHSEIQHTKHKKRKGIHSDCPDEGNGTCQTNLYRSTRLTPMYQLQEKEDREKNKGGDEAEKEGFEEENEEQQKGGQKDADHGEGNKEGHKGGHKEGYDEGNDEGNEAGDEEGSKKGHKSDERFILSAYSIADQFEKLLAGFPGVVVNSTVVGVTASYNNLLLLKISKKHRNRMRADDKYDNEGDTEKNIIFIVHALTPMGLRNLYSLTVENYLKKLLSFYFKHLDKFDILLMPLGNPDGYVMVKNRPHWNKNISPQAECPGVDVDRNFDVAWKSPEKLSSCDMHYPGTTPFSEPESRAIRDVFHQYSNKLVGYFHVHGGTFDKRTFKGDAVLYPRGFSDSTADDDRYIDIRGDIEETMKNANFKTLSVTVDTLHNWYGLVTGTSVDYASTVYGIPYAMELVMQVYQDPMEITEVMIDTGVVDELELKALNEIWGRVIDAIFKNIYRKLDTDDNDQTLR